MCNVLVVGPPSSQGLVPMIADTELSKPCKLWDWIRGAFRSFLVSLRESLSSNQTKIWIFHLWWAAATTGARRAAFTRLLIFLTLAVRTCVPTDMETEQYGDTSRNGNLCTFAESRCNVLNCLSGQRQRIAPCPRTALRCVPFLKCPPLEPNYSPGLSFTAISMSCSDPR
jgi:hypothetical protein